MLSPLTKSQALAQRARRHWLLLTIVGLAVVALLAGQPALAAEVRPEVNQTVPPPTPRAPVDNPGGGDDDNEEDSSGDTGGDAGQTGAPASPEATPAVSPTGALTASVQVVALNVRAGPSTDFPVIGKFAQGDEVTVEGRNEAGDWWYVCCIPGTETRGWVSVALVTASFTAEEAAALPITASPPPPAATPAADATPAATPAAPPPGISGPQGTVAGVNLNVRSGPSTDDSVLGKLTGASTVTVLGRNAAGDWLYICCIGTPAVNGWVSAQFITPAFAAADLPEVGAGAGDTAADTAADIAAGTAAEGTGGLSVTVAQQPPFAVQGREIALIYTVRNGGAADLSDVVLTSELPGPLTYVNATSGSGSIVAQDETTGAVTVTWAAIPAGEPVTATVRVRVAADVPNGTTFANLAAVTAGGGETASSGITIGMPPSLLPEFW